MVFEQLALLVDGTDPVFTKGHDPRGAETENIGEVRVTIDRVATKDRCRPSCYPRLWQWHSQDVLFPCLPFTSVVILYSATIQVKPHLSLSS